MGRTGFQRPESQPARPRRAPAAQGPLPERLPPAHRPRPPRPPHRAQGSRRSWLVAEMLQGKEKLLTILFLKVTENRVNRIKIASLQQDCARSRLLRKIRLWL